MNSRAEQVVSFGTKGISFRHSTAIRQSGCQDQATGMA